jgi:hypothetical protein
MGMVSDHEGMPQVDAMVFFGFFKKVWLGFDADAPVIAAVRADICRCDPYAGPGQVRFDIGVDPYDILSGYDTPGHPRLVRDDEQVKVFLQSLQGRDRVSEKYNLRGS